MTDFDKMTDLEFEMLLENELPEMPPEEIMKEINPISKSMKRIAAGILLSTITISYPPAKLIMQLIGHIMLILGFRSLRGENKWMKVAYFMTLFESAQFIVSCVMSTTWLASKDIRAVMIPAYLGTYMLPARAFCLWRGILSIQQKAKISMSAPSAFMLFMWYIIMLPLAFANYTGGIEVLVILLSFVVTVVCIYKLSKTLDEAGYSVEAAPVKLEDDKLKKIIILVTVLGMLIGMLFFQKVPMNWEIMERQTAEEVEAVKEKLIGLGYPEYALNDLTNEDILACKDAIEVTADIEDIPLNEGRKVTEDRLNKPYSYIKYDVYEYTATDVVVKMGDGKSTWKIFHHFRWNEDMLFCGVEGVEIWPAWRLADDTVQTGELSGRVLYDKKGKTYESEYNSLEVLMHESSMAFMNFPPTEDIYAEFSYPYNSENQRGYVSYSVVQTVEEEKWDDIVSYIVYLHPKHPFMISGDTKQALLDGAHNSDRNYDYIQTIAYRSGRDRIDENRPPEKLPPHPDEGISH